MGGIDVSQTYEDVLTASSWPDALPRAGNRCLRRLRSRSAWFEVYEVAAGTFALLEPHHYEEVISYLILGEARAVLLDSGLGIGDMRAEVEALTSLPVVVVNSHSHYDHVGGNHQFREVWAFDDPLEAERIERGVPPREAAGFIPVGSYTYLPEGFDRLAYEIEPSPIARRLADLEVIELGDRSLTVHHTPGHSPGSICLMDGRHGMLFTGDTLYPGTLYAHFAESDVDQYRDSLARLTGLADMVSFLCPAHNEARVSTALVGRASAAFGRIAAGEAAGGAFGEACVYAFEGLRIAVAGDARTS
jgi:glyoxylase-like metal-dependent hydrolase (beta-lactamase superfamily II)